MPQPTILITGATGFVGGELLERLRATGEVRALVRDAGRLERDEGIEVVEGDLADEEALVDAFAGIEVAYYLVHSMEPGADGGFAEHDLELAETFIAAADAAGVARIVYLGGVQPSGESSEHLDSRGQIEDVLRSGHADLVALRASMVVGAQSDSFRTLAQIVERLPVLALPTWRDTRTQPVAIADVVGALDAARDVEPGTYEIAGPDEITIEAMCETIGELIGSRRPAIPLPFSSSRIEGAAAAAVADSDREVIEPLLEGLHDDLLVEDNALERVFGVRPTPFADAARAALAD